MMSDTKMDCRLESAAAVAIAVFKVRTEFTKIGVSTFQGNDGQGKSYIIVSYFFFTSNVKCQSHLLVVSVTMCSILKQRNKVARKITDFSSVDSKKHPFCRRLLACSEANYINHEF